MSEKFPVFLIDGSSFLYRAYHATRPLTTSKGVPVQAVYGFARMIKKLIKDFDVAHIAIVWDSKGKTKRHEFFPEYKATRQAPPADMFTQKDLILELCTALGIKQIAEPGIEADDLIFSVADHFAKTDHPVIVVSSDKDLAQMVNDHIIIYDPFTDKKMNQAAFEEKYGFALAKLAFYFALLGDTSDNIPGVKGIGQKGATELVQQFESLYDLYQRINEVPKERTRQLLLADQDNALLSLKLFILHNYPQTISLQDTVFHNDQWQQALPLLHELEFKSLIKEIGQTAPTSATQEQQNMFASVSTPEKNLHEIYNFILINTQESLIKLCSALQSVDGFAIDTETTGITEMSDELIGISIAYEVGTAYYIPCGHQTNEPQLSLEILRTYLGPIFNNQGIKKYLQNTKFDQLFLHRYGLALDGVYFDTLIAASLLRAEGQKNGLKELSEYYFNEPMLSYDDMMKKHIGGNFSYVPLEQATWYAAADAHQTLKLYHLFKEQLKDKELEHLFYKIEMPTSQVLVAMQLEGIYCNKAILDQLNTDVSADIERLEKEIFALSGTTINLNSPKQVNELLFGTLGLPTQKKSAKKTGYSTDAQVLESLAKIHPVPALLLKYRELFKLKTTYVQGLPNYINPATGKIHTSFNQTLVATGRLSSSNPNLQNIPTQSSQYSVDIRSSFQAPKDHLFLSVDYSQIELRVLAYLSQDPVLVDAFVHGHDIHIKTAAKIFDVAEDAVTHDQRNIGKRINFSILYGLTAYGLSKDMSIPVKDAQRYIDTYFAQYPKIKDWMNSVITFTKEHGYTTTYFKRRRAVPGIHERNQHLYNLAERIAINTPGQGTAAEIMKLGMIHLHKKLIDLKSNAKIILQIHDELLLCVPNNEIEAVTALTIDTLQSVVSWNVPLTVQAKSGTNWHEVSK